MLLLLLLLLEAAGGGAQSGDGDLDTELGLSCTSHISVKGNSVTCQLLDHVGDEDDEDAAAGGIETTTACQIVWGDTRKEEICTQAPGDTVTSERLLPVSEVNVTVRRRGGGGRLSAMVNLLKIVKPRSPQVWNVSSEPQMNQIVVYIQIPYRNDFLKLENQIFQLQLWTTGSNMTHNISSQNFLQIDMQHLRKDSEYRVRVRALPKSPLQGTWSHWSQVYNFSTPPAETSPEDWWTSVYGPVLVLSLVSMAVVLSSIILFWRNKIFRYMWPSIPHPKQTLVQICKPNKGLLLNLNPEVFSSLRVYPLEKTQVEEAEPPPGPAGSWSDSTQSSACRSTTSVSTEELEISALLGRSSSDGEDSVPSSGPSPVDFLRSERAGPGKEEAYVTMSSFYQGQ